MNTLGQIFSVTSFGESHGDSVGCVIQGCPAGLKLNVEKIQTQVDKRKTNQTHYSSSRNEEDIVQLISGVYKNKTLGSPICILIKNKDAQSSDYKHLKEIYRPNHADFTNQKKYGIRDERGGGRTSIRITAPLVAAGEIAHQLIQKKYPIDTHTFVSKIGKIEMPNRFDYSLFQKENTDLSAVKCPDENTSKKMLLEIENALKKKDTLGGEIMCVLKNIPIGWGEPIFNKLHAALGNAMLSINSVKGFEYGYGFKSTAMKGSEYNDLFETHNGKIITKTNYSGGIQGGISNGMDIYFKVAFKPISSIQQVQESITERGEKINFTVQGRHDVCAVPRAITIVEAYTHIVLADMMLLNTVSKM